MKIVKIIGQYGLQDTHSGSVMLLEQAEVKEIAKREGESRKQYVQTLYKTYFM